MQAPEQRCQRRFQSVSMKLYERENPSCPSVHGGRLEVTKASEESHLFLVAPSHLTDFAMRRKDLHCAGQTLPALVALDTAASHVHALLWQKMQPAVLWDKEPQGSREEHRYPLE